MKREYKDLSLDEKKELNVALDIKSIGWLVLMFIPALILLIEDKLPRYIITIYILSILVMWVFDNRKFKKECYNL